MLITGGAGFIGANAARKFSDNGWKVTVLDNLSRAGANRNLAWLREQGKVAFARLDVRDRERLDGLFSAEKFDAVLHLAAQVAVTTSVVNPREDFEINALGTLNILEGVREYRKRGNIEGSLADTNMSEGRNEVNRNICR